MAERSYSKPHSVGFETVKSSKGFPAARCAASASLSRFGAKFQLVRLQTFLEPHHYRGTTAFAGEPAAPGYALLAQVCKAASPKAKSDCRILDASQSHDLTASNFLPA